MRHVFYTDNRGRKRRTLIRDTDPDSAAERGIPADPPDVLQLDWDSLPAKLHNALVDRGLYTWADVQRSRDGLTGAILDVLRVDLIHLYREEPDNGK